MIHGFIADGAIGDWALTCRENRNEDGELDWYSCLGCSYGDFCVAVEVDRDPWTLLDSRDAFMLKDMTIREWAKTCAKYEYKRCMNCRGCKCAPLCDTGVVCKEPVQWLRLMPKEETEE